MLAERFVLFIFGKKEKKMNEKKKRAIGTQIIFIISKCKAFAFFKR